MLRHDDTPGRGVDARGAGRIGVRLSCNGDIDAGWWAGDRGTVQRRQRARCPVRPTPRARREPPGSEGG